MMLFDGMGNPIEITAKIPSILNGADIVFFGDSNIYYSAGNTLADIGSFYQRFEAEFGINSLLNLAFPGKNTWQAWYAVKDWLTDEVAEQYNKENTIVLFGYATNDPLSMWEHDYSGSELSLHASDSIRFIKDMMITKLPKAQYHWIIPPETDWSKWTGSAEPDERNMAEKMPLIIQRLEGEGIPYCDMYHTSGISSEILSDGIHLGGGGADYTTVAVDKYYHRLREYLMNK